MTREEELLHRLDNAKKRYEVKCQELDECSKFSTQQAIKILDLESRTCDSCKYIRLRAMSNHECENNDSDACEIFDTKDFGCNKWEVK